MLISAQSLRHAMISIPVSEEFAGVVARVESLPLASLGDFVRGRMGELFESLLHEAFSG